MFLQKHTLCQRELSLARWPDHPPAQFIICGTVTNS